MTTPPIPDRKSPTRPRVAVVLGSQGIKAFGAIPILQCLTDKDVSVDLVLGCSGGERSSAPCGLPDST